MSSTFDALGRLASMTTGLGQFTYAYDPAKGLLQTVNLPNGETANYTYYGVNEDLRLNTLARKLGATELFFEKYTYADNGNLLTRLKRSLGVPGQTLSYTYDSADQLLGVTNPNDAPSYPQSYAYDPAGNLTTSTMPSGSRSFTYNSLNERITDAGVAQQFDANGNLFAGMGFTFTWDAEDRVKTTDARHRAALYLAALHLRGGLRRGRFLTLCSGPIPRIALCDVMPSLRGGRAAALSLRLGCVRKLTYDCAPAPALQSGPHSGAGPAPGREQFPRCRLERRSITNCPARLRVRVLGQPRDQRGRRPASGTWSGRPGESGFCEGVSNFRPCPETAAIALFVPSALHSRKARQPTSAAAKDCDERFLAASTVEALSRGNLFSGGGARLCRF